MCLKITDAGDAVVDDDDGDTLFAMDGVHDGTADKKRPEMDEVRVLCYPLSCTRFYLV